MSVKYKTCKNRRPWETPTEILDDPLLNKAIKDYLPHNYNFEIHKTIWRIRHLKCRLVGLQMPDGLKIFAPAIASILEECAWMIAIPASSQSQESEDERLFRLQMHRSFAVVVLGTVTYGACCIDDYRAKQAGCELLVHYGHSCLVPCQSPSILYVFVDIKFNFGHLIRTVRHNFPAHKRLALVSTIQFVSSLQAMRGELSTHFASVITPQVKPLSPGEVLGCTAPCLDDQADVLLYVGDGRFHLEAAMIANPRLAAFKYDPYDASLTREHYDHREMRALRQAAILQARTARVWGLIVSTLGRQAASGVVQTLTGILAELGRDYVMVAMDEISADKLRLCPVVQSEQKEDCGGVQIEAWVQIGCPRLSIDWGAGYDLPLLNPFEASVCLDLIGWSPDQTYPMDFYSNESLGSWTPNHAENRGNASQHLISK